MSLTYDFLFFMCINKLKKSYLRETSIMIVCIQYMMIILKSHPWISQTLYKLRNTIFILIWAEKIISTWGFLDYMIMRSAYQNDTSYLDVWGLGRVFMYLQMIDSITSSAPPPMDNNRKSLQQVNIQSTDTLKILCCIMIFKENNMSREIYPIKYLN